MQNTKYKCTPPKFKVGDVVILKVAINHVISGTKMRVVGVVPSYKLAIPHKYAVDRTDMNDIPEQWLRGELE